MCEHGSRDNTSKILALLASELPLRLDLGGRRWLFPPAIRFVSAPRRNNQPFDRRGALAPAPAGASPRGLHG